MGELFLNVILPIYLLIGLGFFSGKAWKDLETKTISTIVLYFFAPALIFSSFRELSLSFNSFSCISLTALGVFFGVYLFSVLSELLFLKRRDPAFELSSTVMNAGYMGIPLILLMFGERALPVALTYMVVMAVYHFTLGIVVLKGSLKDGLISALKIPLVYALFLSFLLKEVELPPGIEKMVKLSGDATLPLMLFSIGISLSRIDLSEVKLSLIGTSIRFLGGTLTALFFSKLLGCSPLLQKVLVVQSSLPSAILNYVLCEKFNASPQTAASIIFVSTLMYPVYLIFIKFFMIVLIH